MFNFEKFFFRKSAKNCYFDFLVDFERKSSDLSLYQIILLKTFLINEPFCLLEFKYFIKICSTQIYNIILSKLFSKHIFKWFCKKKKKLCLNINIRDFLFKTFYTKTIYFPSLNEYFITNFKVYTGQIKNLRNFNKKKIKNLFFFFNDLIRFNNLKSSIQFIIFLKTSGIIENSLNSNEIRISENGIQFIFSDSDIQFFQILNNYSKKNLFNSNKKMNFKGFFNVFHIENDVSSKNNTSINSKNNLKENLVELWYKIVKNKKFKANTTQGFPNEYSYIFWFFHEIKILFFPRVADNIFFSFNIASKISNVSQKKNYFFSKHERGFGRSFRIVIESNYRIYAYNNNIFLNILLLQFSELLYNLPNLFVGEITKSSIHKAVKKGINSKSIIGFIEKNLHEICKGIPQTVINQIRSWELQQKKTSISEGLLVFEILKELNFKKKNFLNWSIYQHFSETEQKPVCFLKN